MSEHIEVNKCPGDFPDSDDPLVLLGGLSQLPDERTMRYVVGQFEFLARLIELGGQTCERVQTAGGGSVCKRHGWPWTDAKPCPVTHTISRDELVRHLRMLGAELADHLASDGAQRGEHDDAD